jgi:hypothetical protein
VKRSIGIIVMAGLLAASMLVLPQAAPVGAVTTMVSPTRVLDTRDGTGARRGALDAGETLTLRLDNVAVSGATTVFLNLTSTDAEIAGVVTAWPCHQPRPDTSVVNFEPGRSVPNMVVLEFTDAGLCFASSSRVHLVADLTGVSTGGDVAGIAPRRLLDTRTGSRLRAATERRVAIAGSPGIPQNATAGVVNVTVVLPAADGFVIVKPCGSRTNASTVNFRRNEVVAHLTFTVLSSGDLCVVSSVATDVIVDSFGYMRDGAVRSLTPARLLDSRVGLGGTSGRIGSGQTARLQVTGRGNVPARALGATVNVVAADSQGDGFVTLWPCDETTPLASTINTWPGMTRSNQATIKLSGSGELCIRPFTANGTGIHVVLDVVGYVAGPNTAGPVSTTTIDPYATTTTTSPPTGSGDFETLPVGAALPSGSECAARVRPAAEVRPENSVANSTRGNRSSANNRTDWVGFDRVDGDFSGTTDEIIQWASCKWGIDVDVARAQVVKESFWYQSANGDNGESWGLGQVRDTAHQSAFEYSVNARTSSAYNLDYTYAVWRACFEGVYTWLNTVERGATYGPGDLWGCTGVWFSGRWYTQPAINYIEGGNTGAYGDIGVKQHLAARTWETPSFING